MQEPLLTIPEVAKRLQMSERWVAAMCRDGMLPAVKIGKTWRVSEIELEKFITERKTLHETT